MESRGERGYHQMRIFLEGVLLKQELKVFGWISPGSPYIQLLHSASKFMDLGGSAEVRGEAIGFTGDQDELGSQPFPITVPLVKAWRYISFNCLMNEVKIGRFYSDPVKDNHGEWCQPANPDNFVDKKLPQICCFPLDLGSFAAQEPRTCMDIR